MTAKLRISYIIIIKYFNENGVCPCEYLRLIYNLVSKIRRKCVEAALVQWFD